MAASLLSLLTSVSASTHLTANMATFGTAVMPNGASVEWRRDGRRGSTLYYMWGPRGRRTFKVGRKDTVESKIAAIYEKELAAKVCILPAGPDKLRVARELTHPSAQAMEMNAQRNETELDLPTGRATVSVCMDNVKTSCATPQKIAHELLSGIADHASFNKLAKATIRMTPFDAKMWFSRLLGAAHDAEGRGGMASYLEWGTGGSTVMAAWRASLTALPPLEIDTVDSSLAFWSQLKSDNPVLAEAEAAGRLRFHEGDIGKTVMWGNPEKWEERPRDLQLKQAQSYVQNSLRCCYEVILIDGRFRHSCALHALRLSHAHTMVMIHDGDRYVGRRSPILLEYYDLVMHADTLVVLRPKVDALRRARNVTSFAAEIARLEWNRIYMRE